MDKRYRIGIIPLLTGMLLVGGAASAQGREEYTRLLLEVRRLREENASLNRELSSYRRSEVPDLWVGLSSVDPDEDVVDGTEAGFRPSGGAGSAFVREVMSSVPMFSLPYNDIFEGFIESYTITKRKSMPYILGRYMMYYPMFSETFRKYGVPEELTALSIVESAVSRRAASPVGAVGIWQIMPETARQYGLAVGAELDERMDVEKATVAAARILRDLRASLGSWELAVLAYNCGSNNVRKAIIKSGGSSDVWSIYDWLPRETRAYLPSFIAAAYCVRYHKNYSIQARTYTLPKYDTYTTGGACDLVSVAEALGVNPASFLELNCQYPAGYVAGPGMKITVPKGAGKRLQEAGF